MRSRDHCWKSQPRWAVSWQIERASWIEALDELALARGFGVEQGEHRALGGGDAGDDVGLVAGDALRRTLGVAGEDGDAGHGLGDDVGDLPAGVGPIQTEAGDAGPDERGLSFADGVDIDAERFELAGLEGLDHDVCGLGEPAEEVAAVVLAEVERDGALVGVEVPEAQGGLATGVAGMEGRESARGGRRPGGSTLITSAPRSASSLPA